MPHIIPGPTYDASGVLASRLLDFLASKRPSAQEKLGDERLDKARDLARKNGDCISPTNLKIAKDKVLQCVPSPIAYPSCILSPVSAADIKAGLESKSGLSKYLQAREYRKFAKEALRFVKVTTILRITSHRK